MRVSESIVARQDPGLAAIVVRRTPLAYDELVDGALRATPVRSASSLTRTRDGLALTQDDANFIVLLNEDGSPRRVLELPPGEGGHRHFDERRGAKAHKLDLEGATIVSHAGAERLLQFGSGSTSRRERVAILDSAGQHVLLAHAPQLYESLRRATGFSGSELNIEGAVQVGGVVRLFSRGNGAIRGELQPVNASCDIDVAALLAHLGDPATAAPEPTNIVQYQLGALDNVLLGFTDVVAWKAALYYSAAAEDSPDAVRDGRVAGSAIGMITGTRARWAPITHPDGALFAAKVEGLLPALGGASMLVVTDSDNPDTPSALCTVELRGVW